MGEIRKVVEFQVESVLELARELTLYVKGLVHEHKVRTQVETNPEVLLLTKEVRLRELRLRKMELDLRLREVRPIHESAMKEESERKKKRMAEDFAMAKRQSTTTRSAPAPRSEQKSAVEGGHVVKQGREAKPLTHKFPPLEAIAKP